MPKIGIYPGSFNPPTYAHATIATTAIKTHGLDRLDISVSTSALGKQDVTYPNFSHRIQVLRSSFEQYPNIEIRVTKKQLLSDISHGYDLLVLGGDKWTQIQELHWYEDEQHRTRSLGQLPTITVAARSNVDIPKGIRLPVDEEFVQNVSSTAAREGALHMMTDAARTFADETGAWVDRTKYERWCLGN